MPFNSGALAIGENKNGRDWVITDGRNRLATFDNLHDAKNALALAKQHTKHCFIGRHPSTRPGVPPKLPAEYLHKYWTGATFTAGSLKQESCVTYTPNALTARDAGAAGWVVSDGKVTWKTDNKADADRLLALAKRYTARCTIGRDSVGRPAPGAASVTRLDYWK